MSVLEKTSRPTPEALCKELENYIVRQREKMIQVPKHSVSSCIKFIPLCTI